MHRRRLFVAAIAATALLAAGCSSGAEEPVSAAERAGEVADQAGIVAAAKGRTFVDVRTPAEFSAGHLRDAQNIDVQDASFDARISALPKDGSYLVYCRSGNRSAAAIARMKQLGFTDLVDGGGYDDLVAAGLPKA
jgi:phage shock protein E